MAKDEPALRRDPPPRLRPGRRGEPGRLDRRCRVQRRADAGAGPRGGRARRRSGRLSGAQHLLLRGRRSVPAGGVPRRGRAGLARLAKESAGAEDRAASSARRCGATAGSTIAAWCWRAGRSSASCRRSSCPITANIMRSAGSPPASAWRGSRSTVAGQNVAVRHRPDLRRRRPCRLHLPCRDLRGLSGRRSRPPRWARWPGR